MLTDVARWKTIWQSGGVDEANTITPLVPMLHQRGGSPPIILRRAFLPPASNLAPASSGSRWAWAGGEGILPFLPNRLCGREHLRDGVPRHPLLAGYRLLARTACQIRVLTIVFIVCLEPGFPGHRASRLLWAGIAPLAQGTGHPARQPEGNDRPAHPRCLSQIRASSPEV